MKFHFANRKPKKCPSCGKSPVASILWGMPNMSPEFRDKLARGTWTLGGCCEAIPSAKWRCTNCEIDIYHERDRALLSKHP